MAFIGPFQPKPFYDFMIACLGKSNTVYVYSRPAKLNTQLNAFSAVRKGQKTH